MHLIYGIIIFFIILLAQKYPGIVDFHCRQTWWTIQWLDYIAYHSLNSLIIKTTTTTNKTNQKEIDGVLFKRSYPGQSHYLLSFLHSVLPVSTYNNLIFHCLVNVDKLEIVNNLDIYTFYSNIVTWDMYFLSCEEIKTTEKTTVILHLYTYRVTIPASVCFSAIVRGSWN